MYLLSAFPTKTNLNLNYSFIVPEGVTDLVNPSSLKGLGILLRSS